MQFRNGKKPKYKIKEKTALIYKAVFAFINKNDSY